MNTQQSPTTQATSDSLGKQPEVGSFFDHDSSESKEDRRLFIKANKQHYELINKEMIVEGYFHKKGKKTGVWKTRFYQITSNFLIYKDSKKSKKYKKVMKLDRVRIQYIKVEDKDQKYKFGFKFQKNQQTAQIFTKDENLFEEFKKQLEFRCIQNNFQEKYLIEKMIGKGSFGRVYLVKRNSDGKNFAAKMFIKEVAAKQKKGKETLMSEINTLRMMDHQGIMKLYEVHETHIAVYMIVELLQGGELFDKLKERRSFAESEIALMLKRVIDPLQYMHKKGYIHRDIKPENLILKSKEFDYDIVLADFGLATSLKTDKVLHSKCGTPGYCAPEILNLKTSKIEYDDRCDIFSLGCVFYHIITGRSPFYDKDSKAIFKKNRECIIDFNHQRILTYSQTAQDLLKLMLKADYKERLNCSMLLQHEFFTKNIKTIHDTALRPTHLATGESKKRMSLNIEPRTRFQDYRKTKTKGEKDLKVDSPTHSNDFGSFMVARSNIFKGNLETVNEISMMQSMNEINKPVVGSNINLNIQPSIGGESPNFRGRRSSFFKDMPSILITPSMQNLNKSGTQQEIEDSKEPKALQLTSIKLDYQNPDSASLLSRSSRSNSKNSHTMTKVSFESDNETIMDPDGEFSPVSRHMQRMFKGTFSNPFDEEENNVESLVSVKMDQIHAKTPSIQSKAFDDRRSIMSIKVVNACSVPELNFRYNTKKSGTLNLGDSQPNLASQTRSLNLKLVG